MSRVIKFRAWDIVNSVMIYESYNDDHYILTIEQCKPVLLEYAGDDYARYVEIDSEIQQFTGFSDDDGKDCYEGDIVHSSYGIPGRVIESLVYFENGQFMTRCISDKVTSPQICSLSEFCMHLGQFWIIGNKFENPELIK